MVLSRYLSLCLLIIANLIPVLGVIYWNWSLTSILILYWLENLIIGGINILRMIVSIGTIGEKIRTIGFFCIHYGGFWLAHGFFMLITLFPAIRENPVIGETVINTESDISINVALLVLLASNLFTFFQDVKPNSRRARLHVQTQMFAPYGRVMILHITILFGSYLAAQYASSLWVVVLITTLKLVGDVVIWLFSDQLLAAGKKFSPSANA